MTKNRPRTYKTRQDTHSPDLGFAEDQLGVTIDRLQWGGDADVQSFAADTLRELSAALRALYGVEVDPSIERNEVFQKRLRRTERGIVIEADLKADHLAHCADAHLRMIRGMTKKSIVAIRELLSYVGADGVEPDLDRGIFNAKMRGVAGTKGAWHTPVGLWDVRLGDMADRGEQVTIAEHDFDAREKAYVRAVFNKLRRLK
jgi:hypothetical protein